jgi:hypothetical protein
MKTWHVLRPLVAISLGLALAGCSGDDGRDGADGKDGAAGEQGPNGADGKDGEDGANGTNGADGTNGIDGEDGAPGADGMDGAPGAPGKSGFIDLTKLTGKSVIYPMTADQASGVTGSVRFAEFVDGTTLGTLVTVRIKGALVPDTLRTAHIHYNTVALGGAPAVNLNKVDGFSADGTAFSETLVTHVNPTATNATDPAEAFVAGAAITYADFVGTGVMGSGTGFNGYVNVHVIATDTVANTGATAAVVSGNIGKNY